MVYIFYKNGLAYFFQKVILCFATSLVLFPNQVGLLHAVMSDKEYNVILDCLYMNLLEEPSLPPSFRSTNTQLNDSMRLLADKVNLQSQMLLSRTVSVMVVEVTYALLELCNGIDEESPLAHLAVRFKAIFNFFYSNITSM